MADLYPPVSMRYHQHRYTTDGSESLGRRGSRKKGTLVHHVGVQDTDLTLKAFQNTEGDHRCCGWTSGMGSCFGPCSFPGTREKRVTLTDNQHTKVGGSKGSTSKDSAYIGYAARCKQKMRYT